jgi:YHS domain-containing protein
MKRLIGGVAATAAVLAVLTTSAFVLASAQDETPAPLARFEGLVGGWKGTATPTVNRLKGWQESHSWAWKFAKGEPVGVTIAIEGGKIFTKAEIAYDAKGKGYNVAASDAAGKTFAFKGAPTADGKAFVLDRVEPTAEGKQRITIRPNASGIRYTMTVETQATGAPQWRKTIEVGVTKDGESFAAGAGGGADLPKCIITGGAATMNVVYNGKSFPLCCTGCRDEFNDNPEKYIARLAAKAANEPEKAAASPKPAAGMTSGEFDGLVESSPKTAGAGKSAAKGAGAKPKAAEEKAETKPAAKTKSASSPQDLAARELRLGQASEQNGKPKIALDYYKAIVKKYPDTPAAKTAADRIKALETP